MNLSDAKKRIQAYLCSNKTWPLLVDVQTKSDKSEIIDYFKVGENTFPDIESFCNDDGDLKVDELYAAVSANVGNTFITNVTGFLKLHGELATKRALKTLATSGISGHVVVLTYQCKNYLKFSDPRIVESGRVVIVDGASDTTPGICLVNPSISAAFAGCYSGLQKIGAIVENCPQNTAYISTMALKDSFPESIYHISQLNNGYDILVRNDPRTKSVPNSFGTPEQWNYALQKMGQNGNWSQLIEGEFGSELNLCHAIASYQKYDDNKKWLYFIALSISGAKENEYLQMVIDSVSTEKELIKTIFRLILTIDKSNAKFDPLYRQRKDLLGELKDCLSEIAEYCKVLATKGENAIYYLTDLTILEKERVIAWLNVYGQKYDTLKLISVLKKVFPDLASYLTKFRFKNKLLDDYFDAYKYQKVVNHILPSFETVVDEQATKMDFVTALKPRAAIVEKLDVTNSRAFFLDALGVEYLGFIQEKCSEYGLSVDVSCGRCELPSITSQNKEFVATLQSKGRVIADIKDLDDIKHHGEDSFDYEKEKNPIYLIRELEIIDELYYLIRYTSFCEQVEVDGVRRDKYVRQTRREIDEGTVREVYEDGFPEPKSKPFTYVDDEYAERAIRCSRTYYEYAKDICENYRMDLRRYKLIRERKQYIGISNREAYQAMCEDLAFAQQSLKTVLNDYADLFRKRFSEGLSIRKAADTMQQNRGVIERRQAALYRAFAQLLQQRDEADGVCRLMQKTEYDQRDIEDLLE